MSHPLERTLSREGRGGVFYLHGDDEFRKEEAVRFLLEAHADPATADFNVDRLRASDVDLERLASILDTPPMMAEWRVVLLRETEAFASSSKARDYLVELAQNPRPGLAVVLSCTVPSGSKARFYRDLAKHARSVEFQTVSPNDVPDWLIARARDEHGLELDPAAARALGAAVGTDLGVLAQEIDKLAEFVGEGGTIDRAAVEAAGTQLPREDRWQWFDRVGERRLDEALGGLRTLLAQQGESGVGLVIGLATHLLRLGVVKEEGLDGLQSALPGNQQWLIRKIGRSLQQQAGRWPTADLEAALEGLLRVDRLLKSASLSDESLLEEWLLTEIARARGALGAAAAGSGEAA